MTSVERARFVTAIAAFAVVVVPAVASGADVMFTFIVDDSGPFRSFGDRSPSVDESGRVAFFADLAAGGSGIFVGDGGMPTPIATTDGAFEAFTANPTINPEGTVAFFGTLDGGQAGVFRGDGGVPTPIALAGGTFDFFAGSPAINGSGAVAFGAAFGPDDEGIVAGDGGMPTTIARTGGTFLGFDGLVAINSAGTVAFAADLVAGGSAILAGDGGAPTTIARTGGTFGGFAPGVSISDAGDVAFIAVLAAGGQGVYVGSGGTPSLLVDTTGPFGDLGIVSISGDGRVAFGATLDLGGEGLFLGPDPVADALIRTGDDLFGSTVTGLSFGPFGLAGDTFAFGATLADGRTVIARGVIVPEPWSVVLTGLGLLGLAGLGWRRSRGSPRGPGAGRPRSGRGARSMGGRPTGLAPLALLLATGAAIRPADAATLTVLEANGNDIIDFSSGNKVGFDVFWMGVLPVLVEVTITPGDTEPALAYGGIQFNRSSRSWAGFRVELEGDVTWEAVNQIAASETAIADLVVTEQSVGFLFVPPLEFPRDVELGTLTVRVQPDDWFIDLGDLRPGDRFRMRLRPTIPEPSTLSLSGLAAGLLGLALGGRARCRRGRNVGVG